jgi:hypothetical protein
MAGRRCLGVGLTTALALLLAWPAADAQVRRPRIDVEATYDRQPELLERSLAALKPVQERNATEHRPHLYFVGFAGYGPQAVFKREVQAARQLFDQRFGTKGRSIVLINHSTTLKETPLASVSNLERVLRRLGETMDGRDILFLFLTSHGEKELFVVEMPGLGLNHLTPARLKDMLDRSGIKNRVLVVSACHSGSFIPTLANPTTLVITAAHADRSSFGCDDKRDWTYFGDAFFNHALREETSFTRAFGRAERLVRQWEASLKATPSLPQIAGGEALEPQLESLDLSDAGCLAGAGC